jgi:NAD(P)-dependent dehydrogenase (short-subunit alcohol dehydrogenase family)
MSRRWSESDVPAQDGRTILVTGANSGIGFEAARLLAGRGARVLLAVRDVAKGEQAAASIRAGDDGGRVDVVALDLADLAAVEAAADDVAARVDHLDVLVNNAGIMAVPYRQTVDGFELQFGTNHLGHFALTGHLLRLLLAAPQTPRVVTVSSGAHRIGAIDFDNLDGARGYDKWRAYGQSKLANLLFTLELQRRAGDRLLAVAAHPGYAATNLQPRSAQASGSRLGELAMRLGNVLLAQSATAGALPTVVAAAALDVGGGEYLGPSGPFEARGAPTRVGRSAAARDAETAARLWAASEELTGVRYDALEA